MSQKPVFVIVTATGCSACERFKSTNLQPLIQSLEEDGTVEVKHVNFASTSADVPAGEPSSLGDAFTQFPGFVLYSRSSYYPDRMGKRENKYITLDSSKMMANVKTAVKEVKNNVPSLNLVLSRSLGTTTGSCSTGCSRTFVPYGGKYH